MHTVAVACTYFVLCSYALVLLPFRDFRGERSLPRRCARAHSTHLLVHCYFAAWWVDKGTNVSINPTHQGCLANVLVIAAVVNVIATTAHDMQNGFIVNLAISDLLLGTIEMHYGHIFAFSALCTTPFNLYSNLHRFWTLGDTMCRAMSSFQVSAI